MDLTEKTLKTERVFTGKIVSLDVETVQLPNGKIGTREILHHSGAVAILPIREDGDIIMVRQFRKALNQTLLEIPAGKLESGEDPLECAKRELAEEIGCQANHWKHLVSSWTAPGFSNEQIHIFVATELSPANAEKDDDEFIEVETYGLTTLQAMVGNHEIKDNKTLLALFASGLLRPLE